MLDINYLVETAKKLNEIYSDMDVGFVAVNPWDGGQVHLTEDEFFRSFPEEKCAIGHRTRHNGRREAFTTVDDVRFFAIIDA